MANCVKTIFKTRSLLLQTRNYASLVKTITVRPNLRAYGELQVISPGKFKTPRKAFDLEIQYSDSSPNEKKKHTVIAIHGVPGSCNHFEKLVKDFHESKDVDARLIAVSLPDFRHTRKHKYYWNTTPERANFIRQFLSDLNINTVDCFLTHSLGVHTAVALCVVPEELKIRSLCMYAPQPFQENEIRKNPKFFDKLFMFNNNLWYKLLELSKIHKKNKFPVELNNIDEYLLICSLYRDDMISGFNDRLKSVVTDTDIPISLMYGTEEKLVSKNEISRFNTILGLRNDQIIRIDPTIHTEKDILNNRKRVNSYLIENGGHFLHLKYHKIAKKVLTNLLEKLEN